MTHIESGVRTIQELKILPLDGLWDATSQVSQDQKMQAALSYAGCRFYDEDSRFVAEKSITIVGIGGQVLAHAKETDEEVTDRINEIRDSSRELMATSAAFSYLNRGEKSQDELYKTVTGLGHFSIAHTVSVNVVIAGISQATELELNLQRDLVHISKVTNARTSVQSRPPIVVPDERLLPFAQSLDSVTTELTKAARKKNNPDELEMINGFFPVNKATLLMLSGDLSNFRKVVAIRDDKGKEKELRDVADVLKSQLRLLWPEIYKDKEK